MIYKPFLLQALTNKSDTTISSTSAAGTNEITIFLTSSTPESDMNSTGVATSDTTI
jgi:hypothetical protein